MAKPSRTQKQIAERYKGNLGYYRRLHPWRRTRLIVSLLTIFGGLLAIFLFPRCGRETFFTTAMPSPENLAKFCAIVFATVSPSKRSIGNVRAVTKSTAFTKRTSFKVAHVRPVTRNIGAWII